MTNKQLACRRLPSSLFRRWFVLYFASPLSGGFQSVGHYNAWLLYEREREEKTVGKRWTDDGDDDDCLLLFFSSSFLS